MLTWWKTMLARPVIKESREALVEDYLAEGGILEVLLLESLSPKDQLQLFYVLFYLHTTYEVEYENTAEMEDDDYVLFTKVKGELEQMVPQITQMLKDTYEAWLFNEVVEFGPAYLEERSRIVIRPDFVFFMCFDFYEEGHHFFSAKQYIMSFFELGDNVDVGHRRHLNVNAPGKVYRVPKGQCIPAMPDEWYRLNDEWEVGAGLFGQLYGPITIEAILEWHPVTDVCHNITRMNDKAVTKKVVAFYKDFLMRPAPWREQLGNISIALNLAHNTGEMAKYLGSVKTLSHEGLSREELKKLSELPRYLPQGTDHKTLRYIYDNWRAW